MNIGSDLKMGFAATRWCELRIGELLGKGEPHRPKKTSPAREVNGIPKNDRHKFRLLAEHKKLVAKLIDGGPSKTRTLAA